MKKALLCFGVFMLWASQVHASTSCFLAKEKGHVLRSEGDCSTAYSPASTFKIALSLMGFDAGVLEDEDAPSWSLPAGVDPYINVCKGDHAPRSWMRDSCLWYSRILTTKLGMETFQDYVNKFDYGNKDLSGNKSQRDGLTHSWVTGSLHISPEDQTTFLQKLVDRTLPVSQASYDKTKNIMFIQDMPGGWKLYGKTGNDRQVDAQGKITKLQHGWFVGYLEKGERKIVFAHHLVDDAPETTVASQRARGGAWTKLYEIINDLEG